MISLSLVSHELSFVKSMLHYAQERIIASAAPRNLQEVYFLNLHCGHNNCFSKTEKEQLSNLLQMAETIVHQQ